MVGPARCIVEDPTSGPTAYDVSEIDAQGVTLKTLATFEGAEYIDVALELSGAPRQALFAQIASTPSAESGGLQLRWLHMDPSEEQNLQEMLDKWQAGEFDEIQLTENDGDALDIFGESTAPQAEVEHKGTRRVTKPKLKPVDDGGATQTKHKTVRLDGNEEQSGGGKKHKTVRLDGNEAKSSGSNKNKTVRFEATPMNNRVIEATPSAGTKKGGTRRIVRPQTEAPRRDSTPMVTVEGEKQEEAAAEAPAPEAKEPAAKEPSTKRKTRRITRPGDAPKPPPIAEKKPTPKPQGRQSTAEQDKSGAHNIVVTKTQRVQNKSSNKSGEYKTEKIVAKSVKGDDGNLDVGASIRNSAKTVSASELASKHDKLKVLNMSTIKGLIQSAVQEAVEQLGGALDAKEKERLLKEAEEGFKERLESFKAEKKGMEAQAQRLKDQLDRAQDLLEEEKKRSIEKDQFTVSDTGIADLEKQFERMMNKASKSGGMDAEFEGNLRKLVNNLLDDEREKIAEQARKAQSESIALLERKVQRLSGSLEDTEKERDAARRHANELAMAGGGPAGVQNLYDVGLADDDANKEAKLALLKDIFAQNQEMRDHMAKTGVKVEGRKKPPKPKKVEPKPDLPPEEPEADVPAAEAEDATLADGSDEMMDPDDMPWEPGKSYNPEADLLDDEEDDSPVKKIVVEEKAPPKLERKKKGGKKKAAAEEPEAEAPADEAVMSENPDDMPWEPPASDADDEEEASSAVKKMSISADSEPPPLKRKKK